MAFRNTTAPGFTLGGSAQLTAGAGIDPDGAGYLRLTRALNNQMGYAFDNTQLPTGQGFRVTFDFFAYGGTGADGFSFFLFDGNMPIGNFSAGANGGSLGYAQKVGTAGNDDPGLTGGYIGVGIDPWGNFSNPVEGRVGGVQSNLFPVRRSPQSVAVRGRAVDSYPYLAGTGPNPLPFNLNVPTARAQQGSGDFRRAIIDLVPKGSSYELTVRIQHGTQVTTVIDKQQLPLPPSTLRIGYAATTGDNTNIHEIRDLTAILAPIANNDQATTPANQSVTLNALANDVFPGSNFLSNSVDLDPSTPGVQTSYSPSNGAGTFSVTPAGLVTFTPNVSWGIGTVSIPYTVKNQANIESVPATILVNVTAAQFADLTTTLSSNPTSAIPGSTVVYTLTTRNNSATAATNVSSSVTLPAGVNPSTVSVTGGSYNAGTRTATFNTVASLAGNSNLTNTLSFTMPGTSVTATGTTSASNESNTGNNGSSVTTTALQSADLTTTLTSNPTSALPGTNIIYTLTTTNNGPTAATNVAPSVTLPANVVGAVSVPGGTYNATTRVATFSTVGSLASGANVTNTLSFTMPTTSVTASGTVTSSTSDPNSGNNGSTVTTTALQSADLTTTLSSNPTSALPGASITYTLTTTNNGPTAATSVAPSVTLPANVVGAVSVPGGSYNATTRVATFNTVGSLASGSNVANTLSFTMPATSVTATGTATSSTSDPNPGNNGSSVTTTAIPMADLTTALNSSPTSALPGTNILYTFTTTNNGPMAAINVVPSVTLPANVVGAVTVPGGTYNATTRVATFSTVGSLASGSTWTNVLSFVMPTTSVTASGTATSSTSDPNPGNNSSTVTTTALQSADLRTALVSNPTSALPGASIIYTLTTTNDGPTAATNVVPSVTLPANVVGAVSVPGGTYNATTRVATFSTVGSLASGSNVTNTLSFTMPTTSVTASGTVTSSTSDPNTSNNGSSVTTTAIPTADLTTTLSSNPTSALIGSTVTYTLITRNNSGNAATNVSSSVTLPAGVNPSTVSVTGGSYNAGTRTATFNTVASLAGNSNLTNTLSFTMPGTSVTATGTTSASNEIDTSNNGSSVTTGVLPTADLTTTLSSNPTSALMGSTVVYTLTTRNNSGSAATNVSSSVTLPTSVSAATVSVTGGSYNATTRTATFNTVASLASGSNLTNTLSFTMPGTAVTATGTTSATNEVNTSNNGSSVTTAALPTADLTTTLSSNPTSALPGSTITYTLTTRNNSGSAATSVSSSVTLPASVNPATISVTGGSYNATTRTATFNTVASLASGSNLTNTLSFTMPATSVAATGTTSATNEVNTSNNGSATSTAVEANADLQTTLTGPATAPANTSVTYTLITQNNGPDPAINVRPTVTLPESAISVSVPPGATYNSTTHVVTLAPIGNLSYPGTDTKAISFTMLNPPGTGAGTPVTSNGYVTANTPDLNMSNNTSSAVTVVQKPLPVELARFEAVAVKNDAVLTWTTAAEVNNDRFEVERSFDGRSFERVGTQRGQGSSFRPTDYRFTDVGASRLGYPLVYYRLRQFDIDGKDTRGPVQAVMFTSVTKASGELYPNPTSGQAMLDLKQLPTGTYQVRLFDLTGREVGRYTLASGAEHALNVQSLPQGNYVVRVVGDKVSLVLPLVRN
ncbi:T9SS type A sorting domain-containing protein [Hymenobacter sp. BT664]|uniref:T9SS type A sorting domain-containing protein n=1 Tax=Hymenobacter montanus TaxID=2771359 RepID=A0A927BA92_9BACT|nr:T9SS type A sorting domain-containing protein [Hymenobacter montanus]MBD2766474.1 T9SS type A sorting domain-containing protein [Hymenobacter montanus]